jgi:hypothetical protein
MHPFHEIISFTNSSINIYIDKRFEDIGKALNENPKSIYIKALQGIELQKAIQVVGSLSIFESILQKQLNVDSGFQSAKMILKEKGMNELLKKFTYWINIVNVLKHGYGRSYKNLIDDEFPDIKIKSTEDAFFSEGDVSEVDTIIQINNEHIDIITDLILEVSKALELNY